MQDVRDGIVSRSIWAEEGPKYQGWRSKSGSLKVSQKPFMTIDVRATGQ